MTIISNDLLPFFFGDSLAFRAGVFARAARACAGAPFRDDFVALDRRARRGGVFGFVGATSFAGDTIFCFLAASAFLGGASFPDTSFGSAVFLGGTAFIGGASAACDSSFAGGGFVCGTSFAGDAGVGGGSTFGCGLRFVGETSFGGSSG